MQKLLIFLLLLIFESVSAKDYPMLHYTIEDGLPSNTIYDIYEDADGMIWIGSDKGVSRFNGIKFENYTTADGLSDNECFFFQPDYEGRLWIGTYNGKLCFYKDGKFHNEENTPWLKLGIKASKTSDIIINKDSSLIICFNDASGFIEIKNEKIRYIETDYMLDQFLKLSSFKGSLILTTEKVNQNEYLVYYSNSIYHIKNNSGNVQNYLNFTINKIFLNGPNRILLGKDGIFYSKRRDQIFLDDTTFSKSIYIHDAAVYKKELYIASQSGLYKNSLPIISNVEFNSVSIDKAENMWAGTRKDGLYRININFELLSSFLKTSKSQTTFASRISNFLIYSTMDRSVFKIDLRTGYSKPLLNNSKIKNVTPDVNSSSWMTENKYYNFSSTICFTIFNIDSDNYKLIRYSTSDRSFWQPKKAVTTENQVYFKAAPHIILIDKKQLTNNSRKIKPKLIFWSGTTYDLEKTKENDIWFSTISNLYKLNDTIPVLQSQFKSTSFRDFIFAGHYLIGFTHQNELLIINHYEAESPVIDTVKSNNCVWDKFYKINENTLLIGTNNFFRVIELFNSKNKAKFNLKVIENPQIPYQPEFVYVDSQKIYFFKKTEISSFPIDYVLKENTLPKIKFTYLETEKKDVFIKDTALLNFGYSQNIKIRFTPISFYNQTLSYEYIISEKGKPGKWSSFMGEELNLVKIGYGNFTIKVRAKTLSGDYSQPASFVLTVQKPYWATWWFIALISALLVAVIALFARIGIKRRLQKKEGEVRFLRSEYKALNALMNPHFIFNSLNSVQSLINNNENTTASKYIRIFSDLIRQNMRNIANELIPLSKELNLVENYLKIEKLRFKENLNYSIEIDEMVETDMIMVPPLLIQPLVENAIKHGIWPKKSNDGLIQIHISEQNNLLTIVIEDNGAGFNHSGKTDTLHESYAMSNIHQRIEQLSQIHESKINIQIEEIKNNDETVSGVKSTVTIDLPH